MTPLVTGNGPVTIRITSDDSNGADYASKENSGGNAPELIVALEGPMVPDTTPPSKPGNLTASDVQATSVTLTWDPSTDNVGVVAYDIYRAGGLLASIEPVTTYQDLSVDPETSYQYEVRAQDAAGNESDPSDPLDVTTPAAPSVLTFTPTDDASIRETGPDRVYNRTTIEVDADSKKDGLLRFDVAGVGAQPVASVTLRLFVTDRSNTGGEFFEMLDTNWSENSVTWNNAPAGDGGLLGSLGAVAAGSWYELDVTSLVDGGGAVSIRIISDDRNGVDYASKEHINGNAPELIIALQ